MSASRTSALVLLVAAACAAAAGLLAHGTPAAAQAPEKAPGSAGQPAPSDAQELTLQDSTRTLVHTGRRYATMHLEGQDGADLRVRFHGRVVLDRDAGTVRSISRSGFLEVEELAGNGARREVRVEPGDGGLRHVYRVDGRERPFDGDARAWLRGSLRQTDRELDRVDDQLRRVAGELERVGEEMGDLDLDLDGLDFDLDAMSRDLEELEDLDIDLSGLEASLWEIQHELPGLIASSMAVVGPAIELALEGAARALDDWDGSWRFDDDEVVDLEELRRDLDRDLRRDLRHMDRDLQRMERDVRREVRRGHRTSEREIEAALEKARSRVERARRDLDADSGGRTPR